MDDPVTAAITMPADVSPGQMVGAGSQLWIAGSSSLPSPLQNQVSLSLLNLDASAPSKTARFFEGSGNHYGSPLLARSTAGDAFMLSSGGNGTSNAVFLARIQSPFQTPTPQATYSLTVATGSTLASGLDLALTPQALVLFTRMGLSPPPFVIARQYLDDGTAGASSTIYGASVLESRSDYLASLATAGSSSIVGMTYKNVGMGVIVAAQFLPHDSSASGTIYPISSGTGAAALNSKPHVAWCNDRYVMTWWVRTDSGNLQLRGTTIGIDGQPMQPAVVISPEIGGSGWTAIKSLACFGNSSIDIAYTDSPSNIRYLSTDLSLVATASRNVPLPTSFRSDIPMDLIPFGTEVVIAYNDSSSKRLARVCRN
jgi:hypothetical protein